MGGGAGWPPALSLGQGLFSTHSAGKASSSWPVYDSTVTNRGPTIQFRSAAAGASFVDGKSMGSRLYIHHSQKLFHVLARESTTRRPVAKILVREIWANHFSSMNIFALHIIPTPPPEKHNI